jgi:lipoate synthase
VASGLGVILGQFKDNTLEIMKTYKLLKQSVLEVSFSPDSTAKAIPVQAYYRPQGFQEVEAPRFRDS